MSKRNQQATVAAFARRCGVSERTIRRDIEDGLPTTTDAKGRTVIGVRAGLEWRREHRTDPETPALAAARAQFEQARADVATLRLAKLQGRLMTIEDGEKVIAGAFTRVRVQLSNLSRRLAPRVVGLTSTVDAQRIVDEAVGEITESLYAAADEPDLPSLSDGGDDADTDSGAIS